ncbi:hypothetical protein EV356DRAFT_64030 [Viridothelium virens]|uniref:Glutamyl-tRNA amidotransferase complex subunit Gta3 domain-containing protein n=1 Tax=Viridothelium virens TaxID=1048519 RepID=A0A6A6HFE2_VIRVR|nr:hypothetical protein EV356DRAFT_64030 [Viridothelium virens]
MVAFHQLRRSLAHRPLGLPRSLPSYALNLHARHSSSLSDSDIKHLLSTPTWSVKSLLPTDGHDQAADGVSSNQLRHLLRLSALPPPSSPEEETHMLRTLDTQLHFVREIQKVDTEEIVPLRSLRDETAEARKECEIGLDDLKEVFDQEVTMGKHHLRIRRRQNFRVDTDGAEDWDVLAHAERKVGRFFIVENAKDTES